MASLKAVSYTHLAVYKRQGIVFIHGDIPLFLHVPDDLLFIPFSPVSYTHLQFVCLLFADPDDGGLVFMYAGAAFRLDAVSYTHLGSNSTCETTGIPRFISRLCRIAVFNSIVSTSDSSFILGLVYLFFRKKKRHLVSEMSCFPVLQLRHTADGSDDFLGVQRAEPAAVKPDRLRLHIDDDRQIHVHIETLDQTCAD